MSIQTLTSAKAKLDIDLQHGGRIKQLSINGLELLVEQEANPLAWGCYPMAPWVGRLKNNTFNFKGESYTFPPNLGGHALHGTCLNHIWEQEKKSSKVDNQITLRIDLGEHWPFAGFAKQTITLNENSLQLELSVHSKEESFPASIGWHPWFKRKLKHGSTAQLSFMAQSKYACDGEQIPTGELIPQGEGPWDDCFQGTLQAPFITWPKALELTIHSDSDHWIVYDQPEHALCVEPVTAAANALNSLQCNRQNNPTNNLASSATNSAAKGMIQFVTPDKPLTAKAEFSWKVL